MQDSLKNYDDCLKGEFTNFDNVINENQIYSKIFNFGNLTMYVGQNIAKKNILIQFSILIKNGWMDSDYHAWFENLGVGGLLRKFL